MTVHVRAGEESARVVHESRHCDRFMESCHYGIDAGPLGPVADDQESRTGIRASNVSEGLDKVDYACDLLWILEGTNEHQDWECTVEIVDVFRSYRFRRRETNSKSRRSKDPQVPAQPIDRSKLGELGGAHESGHMSPR